MPTLPYERIELAADLAVPPEPPAPASAAVREDPLEDPAVPEKRPASGGVHVVVSIPQQKAYVFQDGELWATSPVSTGKRGHATPTGTFQILEKKVHHRSNKYANAPMPYMQRLTWQGIALHAGSLPGYPASHGCIRLPRSFAKKLYGLTDHGTRVTVVNERPRSAEEALNLA
jgi:lipoprotein-anchoring transpeptidase ErfK/SrfK